MKLSGTHKFKASSATVFSAILTPAVLKAASGAQTVEFVDPNTLHVEASLPIPGIKGPVSVYLNIVNRQAPGYLELQVVRDGRGGSINADAKINLADEADGTLLSYDATAELSGPAAMADNFIGQTALKGALGNFLKSLDKEIA
jgi:Uncharacterized conserved protein